LVANEYPSLLSNTIFFVELQAVVDIVVGRLVSPRGIGVSIDHGVVHPAPLSGHRVNDLVPVRTTIDLSAFVSQMDESKLEKVKIQLFLTDLDGWAAVSGFLNLPGAQKPFTNWLDAARTRLAAKINRDGNTPQTLAAAQKLMREAAKGESASP
jgi:hypothetical protein